jgi:hypothetical protein
MYAEETIRNAVETLRVPFATIEAHAMATFRVVSATLDGQAIDARFLNLIATTLRVKSNWSIVVTMGIAANRCTDTVFATLDSMVPHASTIRVMETVFGLPVRKLASVASVSLENIAIDVLVLEKARVSMNMRNVWLTWTRTW